MLSNRSHVQRRVFATYSQVPCMFCIRMHAGHPRHPSHSFFFTVNLHPVFPANPNVRYPGAQVPPAVHFLLFPFHVVFDATNRTSNLHDLFPTDARSKICIRSGCKDTSLSLCSSACIDHSGHIGPYSPCPVLAWAALNHSTHSCPHR